MQAMHQRSSTCQDLAEALAELFASHLRFEKRLRRQQHVTVSGLESPLVNEVAKRSEWSTSSCWRWKGKSHINVLELASVFQGVTQAARKGGGRLSQSFDGFT